ncbi:unnamed protein product [Heterobilharzia americana]|nr:unnamed protein product [Heterobilharzia americana]
MEIIDNSPPIIYIGFDIARVQKMKHTVALDELQPIIDNCVRRTGIHFSSSASLPISEIPFEKHRSIGFNSKQCGIIRVNCVDCLDRTNTAQFVIGRVVLAYQLYGLGFLAEPDFLDNSQIDRLLQDLYDEHGDTLALQYGGSQLVHNINTYRKTKKLSSHSRDFVQTLSRYYSNKFSDWEKQCAISLFLRVYRPNLWSGTLYDFVKDHLIPRYLLHQNESCKTVHQLHDKLTMFHSDTDQILAVVAASLSGCIWDLCSDAYLHWLDAWSRLPIYRYPFTNWCSRDLLQSLPRGMDIAQKPSLYAEHCLALPSNDIRVDWFNEFYKLSSYVHLDRFPNPQIRSTELVVQHHLGDHMTHSYSSNLQVCNQICSSNMKSSSAVEKNSTSSFTYPTIPMDLGHTICATHSFPNFAEISSFDWNIGHCSVLSKPCKDNNEKISYLNKTEISKTIKLKSGKNHSLPNSKKKKHEENQEKSGDDDVEEEEDETSTDSDCEESMGNYVDIFPPGLNIFHTPSDSDPIPTKLKYSTDQYYENKAYFVSNPHLMNISKRQKRKSQTPGQLVKSKEDSDVIHSNTMTLSQITVNTPDKQLYEEYLRSDFTKQPQRLKDFYKNNFAAPNSLLSMSVDKKSMEIYIKYVQMKNVDLSSIPVHSMNIYKATAYLTSQLLY